MRSKKTPFAGLISNGASSRGKGPIEITALMRERRADEYYHRVATDRLPGTGLRNGLKPRCVLSMEHPESRNVLV